MKNISRLLKAQELAGAGTILAPVSFIKAPITKLLKVCNGCGAANSRFDYVPDIIVGTYVGYACFIHDWQYEEGKTKEDKREADRIFKKNLLVLIKLESTSIIVISLRYILCNIYYLGVKHLGYKSFWRGKDNE